MKKKKIILSLLIGICVLSTVFLFSTNSFFKRTKKYRILACISSFNRPIFVSGQVLRLLKQSYPVDISVSVKGVPEDFFEKTLYQEWKPAIKTGRVKVRLDKNRDQYANLLDTVRNIDLNQYDYFCKIDDDDWYGPNYFEHINDALNKTPGITLSYTKNNWIIDPGDAGVSVSLNNTSLFGPSMCFSRDLIMLALELEKDPEKLKDYLPNVNLAHYKYNREDNFLHQLSIALGKISDRNTPADDLAFGWQYKSITRH